VDVWIASEGKENYYYYYYYY